jgi:hypothetical protein
MLLPADIFEVNSKPVFSHEKREVAVAFDYPYDTKDAVRIAFPATFAVESFPASESYQYLKTSAYNFKSEPTATSVTFRREFALADIIFMPAEYSAFRNYYGKFETKDQESLVLKVAGESSGKPKPAGD